MLVTFRVKGDTPLQTEVYKLTQTIIRVIRRMRTKATATITMIKVPIGVAKSMALSQISVLVVVLGGTVAGVVVEDTGVVVEDIEGTETKHNELSKSC